MAIKREDPSTTDFSDVTTGKKLDPVHPGQILKLDFLEPMGISESKPARKTFVPVSRINKVIRGERGITADTATRLAAFFGTSPEFWMRLQESHDLEMSARDEDLQHVLRRIETHEVA